ncbi:MAG: hypothetical protein LBQ91_03920 [Oscillospiraceae bacterium]|jgi:hypothetical protein|nr:hypothetical protein [Oscillospiraceae bacterium]
MKRLRLAFLMSAAACVFLTGCKPGSVKIPAGSYSNTSASPLIQTIAVESEDRVHFEGVDKERFIAMWGILESDIPDSFSQEALEAVEVAINGDSLSFTVEAADGKYELHIDIESGSGIVVTYDSNTKAMSFWDETYDFVNAK